jgi:hypothetical protein
VGSKPDILADWFGAGRALVPRRTHNSGRAPFDLYDLIPTPYGMASEDPSTLLQMSPAVRDWIRKQMEKKVARASSRPPCLGRAQALASRLLADSRTHSSSGNPDVSRSSDGNSSGVSKQVRRFPT